MKKLIITLSMLVLILLPNTNIKADEDAKVKVYLFRGEGCPHCEEALEWFDSIEEEYGKYFSLVQYEVWNNRKNNELMQSVAVIMNDQVTGVPYIIIGQHSYKGFDKDKMSDEIIKYIMEEYAKDESERYDPVAIALQPKPRNIAVDITVAASIIIIVGGIIYMRYKNK